MLTGIATGRSGFVGIPVHYAVDDTGTIYEIAAHGALPDEEDCHLPIFGGKGERISLGPAVPDVGTSQVAVFVDENRYIADLDVLFHIFHEQPSDLQVEVESPLGTTVTLHSLSLPYQTDFAARFDDLFTPGFNDGYGDRAPSGPGQLSDFDGENVFGLWTLRVTDEVIGSVGGISSFAVRYCSEPEPPPAFVVGDTNADSLVDIADGIFVLTWIFGGGGPPTCLATADVNGDGLQDLGDAVALFGYVFSGGPEPVQPFPTCGYPGTVGVLCAEFEPCQ